MRTYELVFVVHPDLDENAIKDLVEQVKGWITGSGGNVSNVDMWGKRKLAYPIRKQNEGQYVLIQSEMDPNFCAQLERNLRISESVMRFLVTNLD